MTITCWSCEKNRPKICQQNIDAMAASCAVAASQGEHTIMSHHVSGMCSNVTILKTSQS